MSGCKVMMKATECIFNVCPRVAVGSYRDANRVNEEWFADEENVRSKVGLLDDAAEASTSGKVRHSAFCLCWPLPTVFER
jgi:hypothetical protein